MLPSPSSHKTNPRGHLKDFVILGEGERGNDGEGVEEREGEDEKEKHAQTDGGYEMERGGVGRLERKTREYVLIIPGVDLVS